MRMHVRCRHVNSVGAGAAQGTATAAAGCGPHGRGAAAQRLAAASTCCGGGALRVCMCAPRPETAHQLAHVHAVQQPPVDAHAAAVKLEGRIRDWQALWQAAASCGCKLSCRCRLLLLVARRACCNRVWACGAAARCRERALLQVRCACRMKARRCRSRRCSCGGCRRCRGCLMYVHGVSSVLLAGLVARSR